MTTRRPTTVRVTRRIACALAICAIACGCGGEPDSGPVSWSYVHAAVVVPSCASAGCHSAADRVALLDLSDRDGALAALLEGRYVVPGDPNSPLLYQLEGTERRMMPPNGPLPEGEVDLVRRWIIQGAEP